MSALILDGRKCAKHYLMEARRQAGDLSRAPGISVIRVGEDPASKVYVSKKAARAQRLGYVQRTIVLSENATEQAVLEQVNLLNSDDSIDGILVQLPLPNHINAQRVLDSIEPSKDVDGFHIHNAGALSQGRPEVVPCTPKGVMRLLSFYDISLSGKHAVVIGRSNIVGRPMAQLLEQANATVTVCHSRTQNLQGILATADIVVAAVGRAQFVKGEWLKADSVVIDVGINRLDDGRLVGDVAFETAVNHCAAITPVPGGIGPMTIAMLMENTLRQSERHQNS